MNNTSEVGDRADALTALLADAPDPTDHEAVGKFIRLLAEAGLAVLLVWPGSKVPADMRTPAQKRADDKAAQEHARAAGRRDWQAVKSPAGLALATTDVDTLERYLARYVKTLARRYPDGVPVNLAVEVGGSGIVVIDCDTPAQMLRWYEEACIDAEYIVETDPRLRVSPTVCSPGHVGTDGDPDDPATWAHSSGGHFWFTVPDDVELPTGPTVSGAMTWGGEDGFAVLWDRRYVLIPPSVRDEGAYAAAGKVYDLPQWMADAITDAAAARAQRTRGRAPQRADGDMATRIDAWAETVTWAEILEPLGWVPAPRADGCGCEVWTAPGEHASPKSATAHDSGCTAGRYTETNAPLHIWTDHDRAPFDAWLAERGTATISKLQAVAVAYYDNDMGAAMDDLGIETTDPGARGLDDEDVDFLNSYGKAGPTDAPESDQPSPPGGSATADPTAPRHSPKRRRRRSWSAATPPPVSRCRS